MHFGAVHLTFMMLRNTVIQGWKLVYAVGTKDDKAPGTYSGLCMFTIFGTPVGVILFLLNHMQLEHFSA